MSNSDNVREKYTRRIERFQNIMRNNELHKKIFCIGTIKDKLKLQELISVMNSLNYLNYTIHFKFYSDMEGGWKLEMFNWKEWFDY